jgi:hypothetical protein
VIRRIAAVSGVVAAVLLVAALLGATVLVMAPLPSRRGRVAVRHLLAPVDARFDRQGVPHVRAVLEVDAWRALGFIHAADRLFQMELRRRAAEGRLPEIFGAPAVPMDREARTQGYAASARRDWAEARENERAALEAYADGVNAFLADHTPSARDARAPRYQALDARRLAGVRTIDARRPLDRRFGRSEARSTTRSPGETPRSRSSTHPSGASASPPASGSCSRSAGDRRTRRRRPSRRPQRGATRGRSRGRERRRASPSSRATRTWPRSVPAFGTRRT